MALSTAEDKYVQICKLSVYFATLVSTIYKQMDTDAFDLQEIILLLSFYVFTFFILLVPDIVIYLYFVIINDNLLKNVSVTAKLFPWKLFITPP